MNAESISIFTEILNPVRFFGPIFDKELRISSRRRRNYFLRSAYIVLLTFYILSRWFSAVRINSIGSEVYQVSRMAEIGRGVILGIILFQFVVSQILAIIMLSSSISDEIRTGTLNVLMTTPVSSFQVVTGKLLSKLLQVFLLLAISMPLLAIIRVFGGISWQSILSSLFVTLTAAVFTGSLSLLLSVFYRNSYHVILMILVGYLLIFGLLPAFFDLIIKGASWQIEIYTILTLINPFWAIAASTGELSPSTIGIFIWPLHCFFMLCISAFMLAISIWRVRYAGIGAACGRNVKLELKKIIEDEAGNEIAHYYESTDKIRRVSGPPIVWKEKLRGFLGHSRTDKVVTVLLICVFCLIAFSFVITPRNNINLVASQYGMSVMYFIIMVRLAIATAGSIAREKEARTLSVLLMTPLEDRDIVLGKVRAGLWRNIPLIILYIFLNLLLYFCFYSISFSQLLLQVPFLVINVTVAVLFIVGCGAFFGVHTKTAIIAIAATIGSYFAIAYLFCGTFNPLRLIILSSILSSGSGGPILIIFVIQIIPTIFMGLSGFYLLKRSISRLRYNIF